MDLALLWDNATMRADLGLALPDLETDDGLDTAVVISLFTDREANEDDTLPDDAIGLDGTLVRRGSGDRRGWWGDWFAPSVLDDLRASGQLATQAPPGTLSPPLDRIGSRLWLLSREKQTQEVLARARTYIEEALQWLLDDGVATSLDVQCSYDLPGRLAFAVSIAKPKGAPVSYQYAYVWAAS